MYCMKCGSLNSDNSAFCTNCGEKLVPVSKVQNQNTQEQPQQPAPKKKNNLKIAIPAVIGVLVLAAGIGGGVYALTHKDSDNKDSDDTKATEAAADVSGTEKNAVDDDSDEKETTKKKTDSKKKVVETEVTITSGHSFSDGKAWIQAKDDSRWMCIDTDGNIIVTLDCYSATDFVNGYSVIDNAYVIDDEGNTVLDFVSDGYYFYDDSAIDASCMMLCQYVNNEESTQTLLYAADLETGTIEECDMTGSTVYENNKEYTNFAYVGDGYYYLSYSGLGSGNLELYDIVNNKIVTVNITGTTASSDQHISDVTRIGDSNLLRVMIENTLYIVDTETMTVEKQLEDVALWSIICYGDELLSYCTVTYSENNTWYYDIDADELFQLTTSYDKKGYTVLDYENGYFLLSTYDDSGNLQIVLVDNTGKTIIEPEKYGDNYYFEPKLFDGCFAYYYDSALYFVDVENPTKIKSVDIFDDDNSIYNIKVQNNGSLLVQCEDGYYAYTSSGDVIFENENYITYDDDMQDGYRLVQSVENYTLEYWDASNKKLKIVQTETGE